MRSRQFFVLAGVVGVALAVAQAGKQAAEPGFGDPAGKFRVSGILTTEALSSEKSGATDFDFGGNPLRGFSKDHGLVFRSKRAQGQVKRIDNAFALQHMTLSGDVWLQVTKDDPKAQKSNVVEATSQELRLNTSKDVATVTSPSAVTIVSTGAGQGKRRLELKGPNALITLDPLDVKSDDPMRSLVMTGVVHVDIDSVSVDKEGKENRVAMKLTGDRLDYDRATREVLLSGNVTISGTGSGASPDDGSGITGVLHVNVFRLKLDKNNEIDSWSVGNGKATFREGG